MLEVGERVEGLVEVPVGVLVEVVLDDQAAVVLDAAHELLELQPHEAALHAELDDAQLDLLGDAAHHLGALQHGDDVAHGDEVLDLDGGQRAGDLVEAVAVALEGLDAPGWPGSSSRGIGSSVCFWSRDVDGDDGHVLGDGDDRHVDASAPPVRPCGGGCRSRTWARSGWARGARWRGRCGWRRTPG